jgi:uncharacterized protein (DUF2267 family)
MVQNIFDRFFGSYQENPPRTLNQGPLLKWGNHSFTTGTKALDRSVQKANIWLKDLMKELNWSNRNRAYSALRATLHAIRDVLPVQEAVHLASGMPLVIRGIYFENWVVQKKPLRLHSVDEFYNLVLQKFGRLPTKLGFEVSNLPQIVDAVFVVLAKHVSRGEMQDIQMVLHKELKGLVHIH